MARIRTVKPDFFRHEGLQDLEMQHPGQYPMFVFEGLWLLCDKEGRFEWKPRQIKLDILPFLPFDMGDTLYILEEAGFITKYTTDGKDYGFIKSFSTHQRIQGKELQAPARYPTPPENTQGSNGEAPETQPRSQEREKERERERKVYIGANAPTHTRKRKTFQKPTIEEITLYCQQRNNAIDPQHFFDYQEARDWILSNGKRMVDWQATIRTWEKNGFNTGGNNAGAQRIGTPQILSEQARRAAEINAEWERKKALEAAYPPGENA